LIAVNRMIESLECRRLLAIFNATSAADTITISRSGSTTHVNINGTDHASTDPNIAVNCLGGNDQVLVSGTVAGQNVFVGGGDGDDFLGNAVADLDAVYASTLTFDGGAGTDSVSADNSADATTPAVVEIQGTQIFEDGIFPLHFTTTESLLFNDSNGGNRIGFLNLQNTVDVDLARVTINGNGGNDQIFDTSTNTSSGHLPTALASGAMVINGGTGTDLLSLDDESNNLGGSYDLTSNTFTFDTAFATTGPLTYGTIESFELVQTSVSDVTVLHSKPSAMSLHVETVNGDDNVFAGGGDIDSRGFLVSNTTVLGGLGNDFIDFDDHLDDVVFNESETYTLDNFTLAKGSAGFTYGGFDSQKLEAADVISGQVFVGNVVNVNAISSAMTSTTFEGGNLRDNEVNVGNGNLNNIGGTLTVHFNGGGGTLNINDQSATTPRTYDLTDTQLQSPRTINFTNANFLVLNAGLGGDIVHVLAAAAAGPALIVHGGGGDDGISVGTGSFANMHRNVTVTGDAGNDLVAFSDITDNVFTNATLTSSTFSAFGLTHSYSSMELAVIGLGTLGSALNIDSLGVPLIVTGSVGNDTINIGNGNLDANIAGSITINDMGGNDSVVLNDVNDIGNDAYQFNPGNAFKKGALTAPVITANAVEHETLLANGGDNAITVNSAISDLHVLANAGNDTVTVLNSAGFVTVDTGPEHGSVVSPFGDSIIVNPDFNTTGDPPASVVLEQTDVVYDANVFANGTLRVPAHVTLDVAHNLTLPGTIDMAGGAMVLRNGAGQNLNFWRTAIKEGFAAGNWNGTNNARGAINSSLAGAASPRIRAVGYALASEIFSAFPATFVDRSVNANDVLIRFTFYGDADLNGVVNFDDYVRTDNGFNNHLSGWTNGDFDYNDQVNFDDYVLIDLAFNTQR
jgi:hypothetical protein